MNLGLIYKMFVNYFDVYYKGVVANCYDVELISELSDDIPKMSGILDNMIEQLHCPVVALKTNTLITAYNSCIAPEHALNFNGEIVELNHTR